MSDNKDIDNYDASGIKSCKITINHKTDNHNTEQACTKKTITLAE